MMIAMLLALSDPLAPAARGEMQCYAPDVARRTCWALASYVRQADGSYLNTARVLADPTRDIAVEATTIVHVIDDSVCGRVKRADMLSARLFIAGVAQPASKARPILARLADAQEAAGSFGPMICTRYVADGDILYAAMSADGVYEPELDTKVIWVRPDQGYRVAP